MSMLSSYSATGLPSLVEDDASHPPVSLEADVLDRDRDEVYTESGSREMTYDELHEILAWMPAKAVIRYSSSLCTWSRGFHSEPRFIENQCIRSCGHDNGFFLQQKFSYVVDVADWKQNAIEFKVLPCQMGSSFGIPSESVDYLSECRVLDSSNGLLLLDKGVEEFEYIREFIVCNPATREWATLPTPKGFKVAKSTLYPMIECYPRGHDLLDDVKFPYDYTIAIPVVARTKIPSTIRYGLLIYSNGIWDDDLWDVSIEGRSLRLDTPVAFVSDVTKRLVVQYLCEGKCGSMEHTGMVPYIAAFDIQEKKLIRKIELPEEAWTSFKVDLCEGSREKYGDRVIEMCRGTLKDMWIEKWNENSIILVRWDKFIGLCGSIAAWVLDDYGCKGESWRLVMKKSQMELWNDNEWDWTMGVGVASGRGLLIATTPPPAYHENLVPFEDLKSRVFLYVVEGENKGKMELIDGHHLKVGASVRFVPYSNTLRPAAVKNAKTYTY